MNACGARRIKSLSSDPSSAHCAEMWTYIPKHTKIKLVPPSTNQCLYRVPEQSHPHTHDKDFIIGLLFPRFAPFEVGQLLSNSLFLYGETSFVDASRAPWTQYTNFYLKTQVPASDFLKLTWISVTSIYNLQTLLVTTAKQNEINIKGQIYFEGF